MLGRKNLRVVVLGLGGGGFHWEIEKIIGAVDRPMELILVFSGPGGGLRYWNSKNSVAATYQIRSPSLTGDTRLRSIWNIMVGSFRAYRLIVKEHPDLILAVGTSQAVPFGLAARLTGVPLWFVESITRMRAPSRTGRSVARLRLAAKCFYYSRMLSKYYPDGTCMEDGQL